LASAASDNHNRRDHDPQLFPFTQADASSQDVLQLSSKRDGHKRADEDEWPEGQVTAAGGPVPGQQHPAVDGGQGECGKSAGEQCLPADPAERSADTGGEFGVFPELDRDLVRGANRTLRYGK
jgi:hypothetical protein